jgi:stage II sporulation protein P
MEKVICEYIIAYISQKVVIFLRKNLLIFIVCIVVLLCAYRWGNVNFSAAGKVAMENLYSSITNFMFPTIGMYERAPGQLVYEDINGMFLPMLPTVEHSSIGTNSGTQNEGSGKDDSLGNLQIGNKPEDGELTDVNPPENTQPVNGTQTENPTEELPPTTENDTETFLPSTGLEALANLKKQVVINRQKLQDFDYLRQNFYQIDNSTTIGSDLLNVEKLLGKDVTIKSDVEGPQILIYHTHSQEGYKDSIPGDKSTSIVAVGEYLAQLLSEKYGIEVLHHQGEYDVVDHAKAYSTAKPAIQKILKENPTIEVVIDLHRDGVAEGTHLVTQINGKATAQIMFFNGLSRTTAQGQLSYLNNPYIEDNLAFSFQMQLAAEEYFPDLARRIYLKGYRYNMHLCPKSLLIEVGAQTNSFEEARNAMEPLAILLAKVLKTDKVP